MQALGSFAGAAPEAFLYIAQLGHEEGGRAVKEALSFRVACERRSLLSDLY